MALKTKTIQFVQASGLDQRWKGAIGYADQVTNMRVDPNGLGWVADRGIESWWKFPNPFSIVGNATTITENLLYPTEALFIWEKSSTGQIYYFYERAGKLIYSWGNKKTGSTYTGNYYYNDFVYLDTGRHERKTNDLGTQFIPFGNRLLIINGYDKPIWFSGNEDYRQFGFSIATPSPQVDTIQPDYWSGQDLEEGTAAPIFSETATLGIGSLNDETSQFQYFMTTITEDGAESPHSAIEPVSWKVSAASAEQYRFGLSVYLPQGPEGTAARRLYRTKNIKRTGASGENDAVFYFVKEFEDNSTTHFIDVIPDNGLVIQAPTTFASSRINTTYKVGAAWDNRIWLAGGDSTPTRIIYSDKGIPEQFGSFAFFDVGNSQGGHITQLYPYYNNLLVFRRNAIEIVRRDGSGNPTISTLASNLGTEAGNAICNVPNMGVMFLNEEGIWLISGGLDGGSQVTITKVSETLDKEINKINKAAIQRSWACYSKKEREAWFHFPTDSNSIPTRGLVFHVDNNQFSSRGSVENVNENLFRFTSAAPDPEGHFVFGCAPSWTGLGAGAGGPVIIGSNGVSVTPMAVWTGSPFMGQTFGVTSFTGDVANYSVNNVNKPQSLWESNWMDFGDNSVKHRVYSVEVELLSYGDNPLQLQYATDYDAVYITAGDAKQALNERVFTSKEDPVFGAEDPTISKNYFKVGSSTLQDGRIIRLRYDVNTQLVNQFKFRIKTQPAAAGLPANSTFHLLSFHVNYDTRDQMPLNQNTRLQRGQSR
jgi:hypothetical protein